MRALLYLTARTIVNSFRRALQSPTRILGVLFLVAWWFMVVAGSFMPERRSRLPQMPALDLPPHEVIYALMFALFLVVFFARILTMFGTPGIYRPADVDVLFPSPIKPRLVLAHRFVVDYLFTLFIPLMLLVFSGRRGAQGIQALFRNLPDPNAAPLVMQTTLAAFLLLSLFGVALSYAAGMYLNRDSAESRRVRKAVGWGFVCVVAALASAVVSALRSPSPVEALVAIPNSALVRLGFYPVGASADLAIAPLYATWMPGAAAALFLAAGSGLLLFAAMRQADHLYEIAARHAGSTQLRREAARRGDMSAIFVQAAREGKLKPRRPPFVAGWRATGRWAILWREAILAFRTNLAMALTFAAMAALLSALPLLEEEGTRGIAAVTLLIQVFLVVSIAVGLSQSGFLETLRRVDVQKPLPFSPAAMCWMEGLGKAIGPMFVALVAALAAFAARPAAWDYALAMAIGLPSLVVAAVAAQLLVTLLFPDADDPTQRAFRGVMQLLGSVLVVAPGIGVGAALSLVAPLPVAALGTLTVNLGLSAALAAFAGPLYAAYNPSE